MMNKLFLTTLLLIISSTLLAQETHYHRALRSQDTAYGLIQEPHFDGSGIYWSRVRYSDDLAINSETAEHRETMRKEFLRLCNLAYDAFEQRDALHTVLYGDSALQTRYHTPDLYFFMGVSYEQLGFYDEADWAYRYALGTGYINALPLYNKFKERQKQRKIAEKQKKKEEKRRKKEEKKRLKQKS